MGVRYDQPSHAGSGARREQPRHSDMGVRRDQPSHADSSARRGSYQPDEEARVARESGQAGRRGDDYVRGDLGTRRASSQNWGDDG
ncbi:MAG: hypothetical protein JWR01_2886 [Subtercola sp.]|nr:hypothetical protein [Subtercola sp.]